MVRFRAAPAFVALLLAASLVGCGPDARVAEPVTVRVAVSDPLPVIRDEILAATNSNFFSVSNTLTVEPDDSFGTAQVLSENPLRVRFTVRQGVMWSDGVGVDAADLLLAWAAGSATTSPPGSAGLRHVSAVPELGANGRSVTLEFDQTVVDWRLAFAVGLPAHIVAREGLGIADAGAGKRAVVTAVQMGDKDVVTTLLSVWTAATEQTTSPTPASGSTATAHTTPSDPAIAAIFPPAVRVGTGPFRLAESTAQQDSMPNDTAHEDSVPNDTAQDDMVPDDTVPGDPSSAVLVLEANPSYTGDRRPSVDRVEVQLVPDDAAAVAQLAAGTVDVIAPEATGDAAAALMDLDDITVVGAAEASYEAVTLRTDGASTPFSDRRVREAFLATVPRHTIVNEVVAPVQEDAQIAGSFVFTPGDTAAAQIAEGSGAGDFADVDLTRARALLAQVRGEGWMPGAPEACVLFDPGDPNRARAFELIRDSAQQAGFVVTDCSRQGTYTVALVAWHPATIPGAGGTAPGEAADRRPWSAAPATLAEVARPAVDALFDELELVSDGDTRNRILTDIDSSLFADAVALPLYQRPVLTAFRSTVDGIQRSPVPPGVFGNLWNWRPSSLR
jgi:peptide/nickel transport system substrate-binding protein